MAARSPFFAQRFDLPYGKLLPTAVYIARPSEGDLPSDLFASIRRGEVAARPAPEWNLLKIHTDLNAFTFLSYPGFDTDPHPALAEATKINLNTGTVVRTDYRSRANPPILHRKETFLPPGDPRIPEFSALTQDEEAAGLYRDTSRIGHRIQWLTLLKRMGLTHKGHRLIKIVAPAQESAGEAAQPEAPATVERHRTAIKRYDLSKPVKMLLERGLLRKGEAFFDYGCGHGMDIEALTSLGYQATGWDPAFRPDAPQLRAPVVNLGYVLNVIEDPPERVAALRGAWELTERVLLVSTMATGQETDAHERPFGDGFLTKTNTFQKFFAPGELEGLIEQTLDAEASTLSLGICVVFRNPDDAELFEAGRSRRRIDWSQIGVQLRFTAPGKRELSRVGRYELHKELFDSFWSSLLDLGRTPEPGEFDRLGEVLKAGGGLNRAVSLVTQQNGVALWELARKARSEDVLVYLAMTNFRKRFLRREIPLRIRNDIRAFFGDVPAAHKQARELLFAAGDPGEVALAVEGLDFGVYDPDDQQFTFHRSLLDRLPALLRVYVHCAAIRYGNPAEADLIKIHVRSGKLTFLHYEEWDTLQEPILQTRIKISLRTQFVQVFEHADEKQRLLRKDRFLEHHTSRIGGEPTGNSTP